MVGYRRPDPRGRKPARESIRFLCVGPGRARLRLLFSRDMVETLCYFAGTRLRADNFRALRIQFVRWPRDRPHQALIQLQGGVSEVDTFDPTGMLTNWDDLVEPPVLEAKLTQMRGNHHFVTEVKASVFDVKPGSPGRMLGVRRDHINGGLLVQFPADVLTEPAARRLALIEGFFKRNAAVGG